MLSTVHMFLSLTIWEMGINYILLQVIFAVKDYRAILEIPTVRLQG